MNTETAPATIDVTGLPDAVVRDIQQLVQTLRGGPSIPPPRLPSLLGRFAEPGKTITAEEIDAARSELWAKFPRDLPPTDRP